MSDWTIWLSTWNRFKRNDCPQYRHVHASGIYSSRRRLRQPALYWDEDFIEPEVEVTPRGTIHVPQTVGLGYKARSQRIDQLTVRTNRWKATRGNTGLNPAEEMGLRVISS
jgi:hypothetical protein